MAGTDAAGTVVELRWGWVVHAMSGVWLLVGAIAATALAAALTTEPGVVQGSDERRPADHSVR